MQLNNKGLAPCPFCGGVPEMQFNGPTSEQAQFMISHGEDWDISYFAACQCTATGPGRHSEAEAVSAWNRVAPALPVSDDLVERLQAEADYLDTNLKTFTGPLSTIAALRDSATRILSDKAIIAGLEKERDAAVENAMMATECFKEAYARVSVLTEALEPFAKISPKIPGGMHDYTKVKITAREPLGRSDSTLVLVNDDLCVGDFHRARSALSTGEAS